MDAIVLAEDDPITADAVRGPADGPRTAADIMAPHVVTLGPDVLVEDAAKLLALHNISCMPVEGWDGKVVGIIGQADVVGKIGQTVADVMSTDVISTAEDASIEQIIALMSERSLEWVPVMSGDSLLGVIGLADIMRAGSAARARRAGGHHVSER